MTVTARPILFSAPMVRALVEGRKTQTRRKIKENVHLVNCVPRVPVGVNYDRPWRCPYGVPGDLLWVRETFANAPPHGVRYAATDDIHELRKKSPAIHMPRRASRLTLEITRVRVERLQDISEKDAIAEGCGDFAQSFPKTDPIHVAQSVLQWPQRAYSLLWNEINGPGAWDENPFVVAITFVVHAANVDTVLAQRSKPLELT